jgi:quinol monooxygenase YgiN
MFEVRGTGTVARVRMTVEWFVPLGQARPITQALHTMMVDMRRSHGCIGCSLSTGIRDQGTVRYMEEWETEDDLRRRLEGSSFSNLAALIDDATEPPLVEFALPGGVRGLDYVEEARRSKG